MEYTLAAHSLDPLPGAAESFAAASLEALIDAQLKAAAGHLKPQMGWSSWNAFHQNINEELIMGIARGMKDAGLVDAGYEYLNLDDCWQTSIRDENGRLQFDAGTFPSKRALSKKSTPWG
jgi:alpha-galactosidase